MRVSLDIGMRLTCPAHLSLRLAYKINIYIYISIYIYNLQCFIRIIYKYCIYTYTQTIEQQLEIRDQSF
jgi:hypothetical protein